MIEPFLFRLFGEDNLKSVYWVSPWITHVDFRRATTQSLLKKFGSSSMNLIVITRSPEPGSPHEEFVRDAKELAAASIFYMPTLHAKFYVAATPNSRYALLGSANMYKWSSKTFELGVVIEARGDGEILVDALEQIVIELRTIPETIQA